jgi:hypothetical protein
MSFIFPINLNKEIKNNIMQFKPNISKLINECEYKIIINPQKNTDNSSICEFTFNTTLMDNINIKVGDKEYDIYKVPYYGIKVNFDSYNGPLTITMKPKDYCSKINIWDISKKNNYEFVNIIWDKIYIINLKRRPERKEIMRIQMEEFGITNYEFIEAIDSYDEKILTEYTNLKNNNNTIIISAGHYGCLKSHIKAILKAKKENIENIMILEDDITFDKDFFEKINKTKVPKYDMLYLGGLSRSLKIYFENWATAKDIMGTYGYILNKRMYKTVVIGMIQSNIYADTYYVKEIQNKKDINTFILTDYIKTTIESSDTSFKNSLAIKPLEYINNFEKYYSFK